MLCKLLEMGGWEIQKPLVSMLFLVADNELQNFWGEEAGIGRMLLGETCALSLRGAWRGVGEPWTELNWTRFAR